MKKTATIINDDKKHKSMDDYPSHWFDQYEDGDLTQEEMHKLMCEFRVQAQARWQVKASDDDAFKNIEAHIDMIENADKRDSRNELAVTGGVDLGEYA